MSKWLYLNVGYSIQKVAYRGKNAGYVKAIKGEHNLTEKRVKYINSNGYGITGFAFYWVKEWFGFPCIFIKCEKEKDNNFLFEIKNYGE